MLPEPAITLASPLNAAILFVSHRCDVPLGEEAPGETARPVGRLLNHGQRGNAPTPPAIVSHVFIISIPIINDGLRKS